MLMMAIMTKKKRYLEDRICDDEIMMITCGKVWRCPSQEKQASTHRGAACAFINDDYDIGD